MPGWLLPLLINFLVKFGLPALMAFLRKRFPWIPLSAVMQVLADHAVEIKAAKAPVKEETKQRLKECFGVACAPDTMQP
jgi:hypothetical protein